MPRWHLLIMSAEHTCAEYVEASPGLEDQAHGSAFARRYGAHPSMADLLRHIGTTSGCTSRSRSAIWPRSAALTNDAVTTDRPYPKSHTGGGPTTRGSGVSRAVATACDS